MYAAEHIPYRGSNANTSRPCEGNLLFIMEHVRDHANLLPAVQPETQWDALIPEFIRLLDLAEGFIGRESMVYARGIQGFEMGIIIPLFETAFRCRNPTQRRRAITMLRSAQRREGVWDGIGAAAVIESIVDIEEEGLTEIESASDVPEDQRVFFINPLADLVKREVLVTYYSRPQVRLDAQGEAYNEWSTRQKLIKF